MRTTSNRRPTRPRERWSKCSVIQGGLWATGLRYDLVALFAAGRKITSPPWIEIGGPNLGREDAVIRDEANATGRCTLPLAQIAERTNVGRAKARAAIRLAEGLGVIAIEDASDEGVSSSSAASSRAVEPKRREQFAQVARLQSWECCARVRQRRSLRRSSNPTAGRLALAASPVQQHPACCQQLTATHERDHGLVRLRKDSKRVGDTVSTHRLPFVHAQDGAFKQRSDDLIGTTASG